MVSFFKGKTEIPLTFRIDGFPAVILLICINSISFMTVDKELLKVRTLNCMEKYQERRCNETRLSRLQCNNTC